MSIIYKIDVVPEISAIVDLYISAGLNRPVTDTKRIGKMYANSNLVISAWDGNQLVGIARSLTDFCYACYLSDLAVNSNYQKAGIGRQLVQLTRERIGEQTMLLLLSAPGAMAYYPKIGFDSVDNGFIIKRKR